MKSPRLKKARRTFVVRLAVEVEIGGAMPTDQVLRDFASERVQAAVDNETNKGLALRISDSWGCETVSEITEAGED